jgi:RNA polymerase sigma factor (sigma-70 family)
VAKDFSEFEALRPRLLGLARIMLRNARVRIDPEDLVQTVFAEIYAKLEEGKEIKNPSAYANSALKNRALDEIRRFHNKYEHEWPTHPDDGSDWEPPDPSAIDALLDPEVRDVLQKLEEHERCFLWRVVFEQRAVYEAQKLCGWPPKSPYFHYRKLLAKLRTMMGLDL